MKINPGLEKIKGGVTAAYGFKAGGVHSGIKGDPKKRDIAIIYSTLPATAVGTFTTNAVKAAPVHLCKKHVVGKDVRAIIANSGNANACNGDGGMTDALRMAEITADHLGLDKQQILVCSTGRIGVNLPMTKLELGIPLAVQSATATGSTRAANAIMTSDKVPKEFAVKLRIGGKTVHVGGIAKGAGMIDPNMATMLSFITTDAVIGRKQLAKCLRTAVAQSFNRITVDGDMSTNDTVLMLANGGSGCKAIENSDAHIKQFQEALNEVTRQLAWKIVEDGEGASKFIEVEVNGAANATDARKAAEAIANSQLVKCAWSGEDPNWGRILCAIGYSGAKMDESKTNVFMDDILVVDGGVEAEFDVAKLTQVVTKRRFKVRSELNVGKASYTVYTTDLTSKYVVFNQEE